jgi:glycosyltransferase involved in cell wall biosynthesis
MVLPSIEEGMAMVQAEALASGCPVIATPNTGSEDLFSDGVEGFIIPARDTEALRLRLEELADTPDLRRKMSEAGLARVRQLAGWRTYFHNMRLVYEELVAEKGAAPSSVSAGLSH